MSAPPTQEAEEAAPKAAADVEPHRPTAAPMSNEQIMQAFATLHTPQVADACLRLRIPYRVSPPGLVPVIAGTRLAGRVRPVRHYGSVDAFLEAFVDSDTGDVLVIDNGGRADEGCIGDLTALEAKASGISGIMVWGLHRDHQDLIDIALPVFSYGRTPTGPQRLDKTELDAFRSARFGGTADAPLLVTRDDAVFADDDGAVFVPVAGVDRILAVAAEIMSKERSQAKAVASGDTLRKQLAFDDYITKRREDPAYTFRAHLAKIGGAIEE